MIGAGSSPLLDHVWGISPGADRVWAQIAGMAPSTRPWERLFLVLQAYIDDSRTADGVFVLAGWIAPVEVWAQFAKEWEELLPLATIDAKGKRRFKMSDMVAQGRMRDVAAFYRVIEKHVSFGIACKIDSGALKRAKARLWVPDLPAIDWGFFNSPYLTCFRFLLHNFHSSRVSGTPQQQGMVQRALPPDQPIDFYFDDQSDKGAILSVWDEFAATRPESVRDLYGHIPRFEKDEEFLALQGADFWAWWVREAFENGTVERIGRYDFGLWKGERAVPGIIFSFDEDQIVAEIISTLRAAGLSYSFPIYDAKYHPKPGSAGQSTNQSPLARLWSWLKGG